MPSSYALGETIREGSRPGRSSTDQPLTCRYLGRVGLLTIAVVLTPGWTALAQDSRCPTPTPITWDQRERSLAEFADELSRQANVAIDLSRADPGIRLRLPLTRVAFWEALERLAEASDHRLIVTAQGSRAALARGPRHRVPTYAHGAFRLAVRETRGKLDLVAGTAQTDVVIDVAWEPSFKAYFWQWERGSWRVEGADGSNLPTTVEGTSRVPVSGDETPELRMQVRPVPREMPTFRRVAGRIRVVGTCQMPRFVFGLNEPGKEEQQAGISARLVEWRRSGRLGIATVALNYPNDMPELDSFESFLVDHEAWLQGGMRAKFRLDRFEIQEAGPGTYRLRYYVSGGNDGRPDLDRPEDWQLALRVPGRIVEEMIAFELTDVPIP